MQHLPGIHRIGYVKCSLLPADITLRALSGTPVGIYTTVTDICKVGEATCETEAQFDNNSHVEKATLIFRTLDELPTFRHLAFVIFTVQGDKYIIGTREQPFPIIKEISSTGSPDGDAAAKKYEVTFTAKKALVRCAV